MYQRQDECNICDKILLNISSRKLVLSEDFNLKLIQFPRSCHLLSLGLVLLFSPHFDSRR